MEYRLLGRSGLVVPALSLGTATFGGGPGFDRWGTTAVAEATRMVDLCLDHGVNFFDTADVYSQGVAEEVLGAAIRGKRDKVLLSTKASYPMGTRPMDGGSSRHYLTRALEASLKRLGTDYIDVYFMHGADLLTPIEETMATLDGFVKAGKVGYIGCSNFSAWQVMKSQAVADAAHGTRYVAYQGYYSLIGRDYEAELMPLALDQGIGTMVWSPLGWGRLTGKIRRDAPLPEGRIKQGGAAGGPTIEDNYLFAVVDVLLAIAEETGKTVPQIALNWLLSRPSVANIVIGARNEEQLKANLGAVDWILAPEQLARLDAVSQRPLNYPYWHQAMHSTLPRVG